MKSGGILPVVATGLLMLSLGSSTVTSVFVLYLMLPQALHEKMAHGASTSRPRRFPIAVEVKNEFAKGYGVLPMSITSEFGSQIGRKPTIGAADGQIYSVRFEKTSDGGLLTTGWSIFVQQCNLVTKTKVILQYVGESYFLIKSSYHKQNRSDFDKEMDNSSEFSDTPPLMQEIIITPYSAKNHQPLPAGFVQSCLNVNLSSITLWKRMEASGNVDFTFLNGNLTKQG